MVLEWVVMLLYSPDTGWWKSPEWPPSWGKGPGEVGAGGGCVVRGWCQERAWPEKGRGWRRGEEACLHPGTRW